MATLLYLLSVTSVLIIPLYIIYKPPPQLIKYLQRKYPDILWQVPTLCKTIALTIDDGPSQYTEQITAILRANEATATFFVIGSHIPGREGSLLSLVRDGNELANHTMYDVPSRSLGEEDLVVQIGDAEGMIRDVYETVGTEMPPKYFRPGSGFFSTKMRRVVRELGYRMVLGSIYPHDPQIPFWRINAWHVLSMLRPGAIVICHDGRSWTVPMLERVLPEIRSRGYRVVTVTELLDQCNG